MAVTDTAIRRIKQMITTGELKPGDRLPPEKDLSERLGISRSSMREAVKALEVIRVLDVRRGDGTYVTSLEPALLLEAVSFVADLHDDDTLLEIFGVRRILEPAAVALAAARITEEDVAELRAQLALVDEDTPVDELVQHDLAFHASIVRLAGNTYLATLLESLSVRTVRARVWRGLTQDNAAERTLAEHAAIVDALEMRDGSLGESLTTAHIFNVEKWLRGYDGPLSDLMPPLGNE
ncbi:FadR/GntR family transcriptional regulator [Nocardioides sp. GY 10127]|uniref:FadR/GntR family transcriptional regulator n=1 Tax=Nocardioides sp. GY 10127 TaxID=2569762 RepID=UPI0010A84598|nr:FadR/GntR family transcriptional regulator [Nocardioides sp. GY 10127]TIC79339.1 FadR family transcriptional regulator [Nocardioides sp. GY 10127]